MIVKVFCYDKYFIKINVKVKKYTKQEVYYTINNTHF